jgi:hypothetical protein
MRTTTSLLCSSAILAAACAVRQAPVPDAPLPDAAPTPEDSRSIPDCDTIARWIYLATIEGRLLRFEPDTGTLTPIAPIDCATRTGAYSMGIDREANAFVRFGDNAVRRVSTVDGACEGEGPPAGEASFGSYGMAFVGEGEESEVLYVAGERNPLVSDGVWLGRIDGTELTPLARLESPALAMSPPELTGTATGELWAYYPNGSAMTSGTPQLEGLFFRRYDPRTGATLRTIHVTENLPEGWRNDTPGAWAFAFWGGRFYVFLSQSAEHSQIFRVRVETGEVERVTADAGYVITGAGVSTCAPTDLI